MARTFDEGTFDEGTFEGYPILLSGSVAGHATVAALPFAYVRFIAGTSRGTSVASAIELITVALSRDRMLATLPSFYDRSEYMHTLVGDVISPEIDRLWIGLYDAFTQLFVLQSTWLLPNWEAVYGLPYNIELTFAERHQRLLSASIGSRQFTGPSLQALIRTMVQWLAFDPLIILYPEQQYAVFKLREPGFPSNFPAVEAAMRHRAPSGFGAWLAAWDSIEGLTLDQVAQMELAAVDELTLNEVAAAPGVRLEQLDRTKIGTTTIPYTPGTVNSMTLDYLDGILVTEVAEPWDVGAAFLTGVTTVTANLTVT